MTDVNIISGLPGQSGQSGTSKNSGGILIGLALAAAGLVWYFLTKKNTVTTSQTPGGASYGESITGGSGSEDLPVAPVPVDPFQTFTNWWNSLFPAPGAVPAPANTSDAMLAKLADARVSTDTSGNAAETLLAAMRKNPSAVKTVKLPAAMQAAIDKSTKTTPTGGSAYNALAAALAKGKGRH